MHFLRIILMFFMFVLLIAFSANAQMGSTVPDNKKIDSAGCEAVKNKVNASGYNQGVLGTMMNSGGSICPCTEGIWIKRVIECFTSEEYGLIPAVVKKIIATGSPYKTFYNTLIYGTILLAVVLFALKMIMGSLLSLPKESMTLVLKIGGVLLFFSQYETIYIQMLELLSGLVNIVGTAAGNIGNTCGVDAAGAYISADIWARWDCLFQKFTGLIGGYLGGGMIMYATSLLFTNSTGFAMFFGLGYIIVSLLLLAMRLVYNYLVGIIAVSFIYLLAPLFVPLIFFGQTYQKFATWFKLMLAYLMQPMFIILFSVLMLTALEFAIFVGPTSLYHATSGNNLGEVKNFSEANHVGLGVGAITGGGKSWRSYVYKSPLIGSTFNTNPGINTSDQNKPDAADPYANPDITLSNSAAGTPEGSFKNGFQVLKMNIEKLADDIGKGEQEFTTDLMVQIAAVAILLFVLYNLVHAVPQITHDLVAQGLGRFGGVNKARMIGETEIRSSLEGSKEIVRRGKETGDVKEAARQVQKEAQEAIMSYRNPVN